jgi:hypothetical protein
MNELPIGHKRGSGNRIIYAMQYEPVVERKKILGIIPFKRTQHRCTGCYWYVYFPNHSEGAKSVCHIQYNRKEYGECMACSRTDGKDIIFKRIIHNPKKDNYYIFDGDCETVGRAIAESISNIGLSIF